MPCVPAARTSPFAGRYAHALGVELRRHVQAPVQAPQHAETRRADLHRRVAVPSAHRLSGALTSGNIHNRPQSSRLCIVRIFGTGSVIHLFTGCPQSCAQH
jgi:hypothetical protein